MKRPHDRLESPWCQQQNFVLCDPYHTDNLTHGKQRLRSRRTNPASIHSISTRFHFRYTAFQSGFDSSVSFRSRCEWDASNRLFFVEVDGNTYKRRCGQFRILQKSLQTVSDSIRTPRSFRRLHSSRENVRSSSRCWWFPMVLIRIHFCNQSHPLLYSCILF